VASFPERYAFPHRPFRASQYSILLFEFQKVIVTKAAGAFGIITAMIAYYLAVAELLVKEESYFALPVGNIPKRQA
jgi:ABC-type enterobactin transport system permease subunit